MHKNNSRFLMALDAFFLALNSSRSRGRMWRISALCLGLGFLSSCTWIHSSLKRTEFAANEKGITDNENPFLSEASFAVQNLNLNEDTGSVSISVVLSQPSLLGSSVQIVADVGSSAKLPGDADFVESTILNFAPGEVAGSVQLRIENDSLIELKEKLILRLQAVENIGIGSANTIEIEILDNDMIPFVWTGAAGDGLWTTAGNWSTNAVPGANQVATFAGACAGLACNATINNSISIGGIDLRENYSGQLTQGVGRSIQLSGSTGITQKAGIFAGSNSNITSPKIDVLGGSFSATSATMTVNQLLRVNSQAMFNHRSGAVHVFGINGGTVTVQMGSAKLNNLTTSCMVSFGGQNIQVEGNLTFHGGYNCYVTNGTLRVNGNINFVASTNPAGYGVASDVRVIAAGNPNGQTITGNGGSTVGILEIDAGANPVTLAGSISVVGLFGNGPKFPEFKITSVGEFNTAGSTLSVSGGLAHNGPGSAQYFFGNKDMGSVVFQPGGSFNLNGQTLNVRGTLTMRGGYNQTLLNGTIKAYGNVSFQAFDTYGSVGSANIIVAGNPAGQIIQSVAGAAIGMLEIDAGSNFVDLRGPLAISGLWGGAPGVYRYTSGNLNVDSSNVLSCSNYQQGCRWIPGPIEYNDFVVTGNQSYQIANSLEGGTLRLKRDLTLQNNALFNSGAVEIGRNLVVQGNTFGNVNLTMKGSGTITGAFRLPGSGLQIHSSGTVNLASNLVLTGAGQDLIVQSGTLMQNNFNIQVADRLQIQNGASLDMQSRNLSVTNVLEVLGTLIRGPDTSSCGVVTAGSTQVSGAGAILPAGCSN